MQLNQRRNTTTPQRLLSREGIPSCQIVFMNSVMRCILAVPQLWQLTKSPFTSQEVTVLIAMRAIAGAIGISCAFYALSVISLGEATVILFTAPVWTALLAAMMLGEALYCVDGVSLVLCLCGVTMVAHPWTDWNSKHMVGILAALGGAILNSISYCVVRRLGKGVVPAVVLVFAYSLLTVAISPLLMLMLGQRWTGIPNGKTWGYIIAMGLIGYIGSWLLNRGLQMGAAAKVTLARNLDIVFAFVLQATILGNAVVLWSICGAVLITGTTLLNFWKTYSDQKAIESRESQSSGQQIPNAASNDVEGAPKSSSFVKNPNPKAATCHNIGAPVTTSA